MLQKSPHVLEVSAVLLNELNVEAILDPLRDASIGIEVPTDERLSLLLG